MSNITIFEKLAYNAENNPKKIVCMDEECQISANRLFIIILNSKDILHNCGIEQQDTVILKCKNQLNFVVFLLCLFYNQNWVIPLSPNSLPDDVNYIMDKTNAKYIEEESITEIVKQNKENNQRFILPDNEITGIYHLTSGTTNLSKLCIRTLKNLEAEGYSYQKSISLSSIDRIMSISPLYHSYAMGAAIMGAFTSDSLLFAISDFVPRKVMRIINENQISVLYLVPFMAKMLTQVSMKEIYDFSCLRLALVGAGPINQEINDKFKNRFGIDISGNYGSTETGGMAIKKTNDPLNSIGKPMYGVMLKICDRVNHNVPIGEIGELWVKSPSMMEKYYDTNICMDVEGFIPTGDIALKGMDDNFYIKGRKKMFIDIGSKKVNPFEVEEIIKKHPKVKECVVTSFQRKNSSIAIKAIVVGEQLEESEIRSFCKENINPYSLPSIIEIRDSIPKNELGKIIRSNLG